MPNRLTGEELATFTLNQMRKGEEILTRPTHAEVQLSKLIEKIRPGESMGNVYLSKQERRIIISALEAIAESIRDDVGNGEAASSLGFEPVAPQFSCFCGENHLTGFCLRGAAQS